MAMPYLRRNRRNCIDETRTYDITGTRVVYSTETATETHCFICYVDYKDSDVLLRNPCKHEAHYDCLAAWMRKRGTCPICNAK